MFSNISDRIEFIKIVFYRKYLYYSKGWINVNLLKRLRVNEIEVDLQLSVHKFYPVVNGDFKFPKPLSRGGDEAIQRKYVQKRRALEAAN